MDSINFDEFISYASLNNIQYDETNLEDSEDEDEWKWIIE